MLFPSRFFYLLVSSVLASLLIGCATSKQMHLPDGSVGHNIQCNGAALSMADCFQKAGDLCGAKGYVLLNREGEAIPFGYSAGSASAYGNPQNYQGQAGYTSTAGMVVYRSLFVKCKE